MKILIVDDKEEERYLAETLLKGSGYEVVTAVNGAEALEKLRTEDLDMIVSDVLMPVMDGFRLCRECKKDEKLKDIPFVFYTATYKDERDEELASKVGADKYIRKPLEPGEFVKVIQGLGRDIEEGKIGPKKLVLEEEKEVLKLYSERLIEKLEKKMLDMEAEIAQRKQAEEKLQIAEQNFRNSLDNSPLGIRIVTAEGKPLYANQAILDIYGYSSIEELKAVPTKQRYTPKSYAGHQERIKRRNLGKPAPPNYEISIVRKDGEIRHLALYRKEVMWGGETQFQTLYQDITERKRAEHSIRERIKELTGLYRVSQLAAETDANLDEILKGTVDLIPGSWQYPGIACARVTFGGKEFKTDNFAVTKWRQSSDIEVGGEKAGALEIYYLEEKPELDEGPFLKEERNLIDGFARILGEVAERKRAEEQTKQLREYLQLQVDRMPIGLIVWDTEFRVQTWNPAAEEIFGFTMEEALGKHPYDFIVPREAQPQVDDIWRRLLEGDTTAYSTNENITKDGRTIICDWSNTPLKEADGTVTGILSMVQDITERKQAEEKIKRAAEEWTTTFDSITDLVSICDKDFRLIRVNKAFADAFKMKPEELIGKPCYEIVHGTNEPLPNCPHKVTIKTKKPATVEFFEPYMGMHLELSTSPIFNENGEVVASVHLIRDITERKRMEGQLIITDRLASIGELSSGIAHELNNPLTSVIGFSELLLDRDVPDDVKEDLEVINREAKRTAEVVRNLLTFARKHDAEKKPVDIHNIIQKVLDLRAYEQKVSNIEVNTRFAPDLPEITADGFQLQQVFINIIINAEHFMIEAHRRGTLTITTERLGDIIRASFADDGPGIAKENIGHLFDPFFTTKEVGKGTGLGLSICHGIITEHGGRIYAESKLGKGATFVVELPISKQ